ncbi:MAG: right-handed parallel beta-helix repeat-containing protein, partial [Dehalococcoidales bacterium]|nr:right-handed parallel beta-helix repeat-containing protein [Dehalococcoidales bacterium]
MKRKFSKILGIGVTLALLSSLIVAPMAGAVTQPTVTLDTGEASISLANAGYSVVFNLGRQIKAGSSITAAAGAWVLADIGDTMTFTATTQGDVVTLPTANGTVPTVVLAGGATIAAGPPAVITFNAVGATAVATAVTPADGTWAQTAQTAAATVSGGAGAYTLPVVGDTITFTSALATDVVTLTITSGTLGVAMSGAGTYAAGVITFAAAGEVATVTCLTAGAGTWAQTAGGATVTAASARVATTTAATGTTADTITITFPYDTGIAVAPTATIVASPGWIDSAWAGGLAADYDNVTWVGTPYNVLTGAAAKIVGTLGNTTKTVADCDKMGEGAQVRIAITAGITNPATIGDYTLTVKTSATGDTTAVTSTSYAITAPTVAALPGIVRLYNSAGVEMASQTGGTAIATLLTAATGMSGSTIKIGPGTYVENITTTAALQTIEATGTAAETIVVGTVTVNQVSTTIQGLTLKAAAGGGTLMTITGDKAVIQNNVIVKGGTAALNSDVAGETLIAYNNAVASTSTTGYGTITNNTFDTTKMYYWAYRVADTSIDVNATGCRITNNTFTVDTTTTATVGGTDDIAIDASAGALLYPTTVSGNTINGSSGTGIRVTAGYTNISTATMSNLGQAILVNGATAMVSVANSTISGCGVGITLANGYAGVPAIEVTAAAGLTVTNTTITGGLNDIMEITANADNVIVMFNDLSGNALGIDNNDAVNTLNATNNLWNVDGSAPPATLFNAGLVNVVPVQGSAGTGALTTTAVGGLLTASTTAGVDVEVTLATGGAW